MVQVGYLEALWRMQQQVSMDMWGEGEIESEEEPQTCLSDRKDSFVNNESDMGKSRGF